VKSGKLSEEFIDRSLERVLRAKFELGLFEQPYADPQKADAMVRSKEHVALSLEAARESMVLLKNENVLPLDRNLKTIGLFGQGKDAMNLGDYTGPYGGWYGHSISPAEGIRDVVSEQTQLLLHRDGENPIELAKKCDAAIIFTEIFETEGGDRSYLDLPGSNEVELTQSNMNVVNVWERDMKLTDQQGLIRTIAATGIPTVVVLVNGAAVTMQNWIAKVGAVLEAWYPGEQGGRAIAEVLFGDYNPGGKLPLTFPKTVGQLPLYYNCKPSGRGYAYSDNDGKPQFPFGHGLSYTQFTYDKLEVCVEKGLPEVMVTIRVEVENTGNCRGDEVVQVYINDEVSSVVTPLQELKGFKRIGLDIAEKSEVEFVLRNNELALWNMNMEYVVEPGTFKVMVGSSSEDIRVESSFEIK